MRTQKEENARSRNPVGEELESFIVLLRDGDNFEKEKAIDALVASPGKEVVEQIIPLLQEKNTPVRMAVLDVLKEIGSTHLDGVIGMLEDDNEDIRVYACEVLSVLRDPRSIPIIVKKSRDDAENVRNAACMALGEFDDDEAVEALLDALKDEEWIAFSAILSLGRTRSPRAVPRILQFFRESGEELSGVACEVLVGYGDDAILDEIFDVLKGWDREKRSAYLKVVLEKGNEHTFERLKEKIGDELFEHLLDSVAENRHRPIEIVRMLTHFRTPETCRAVLDVLKAMEPDDENYDTVLGLFASLGDIWAGEVAGYMGLDEANLLPLIRSCKMTGVKVEEEALLKRFLSAPVELKREIVMNVPAVIDGNGCSIIKEALKDTDGHIKGFAVEAVGDLRLMNLKEDIIRILGEDFYDVRVKALKTLIRLDPALAMEMISAFVDRGSVEDKKVYLAAASLVGGEENLPFVTRLLFDEDEGVRRSTISVLGSFADDENYMELIQKTLMGDDIPHEVFKVVKDKRLNRFRDRLVVIFADEGKGMWTRYYALSALGAFKDPALFDIFVRGLEDGNGLITIGCIRSLADLGDARAMDCIRPFVDSANDDIRSAAQMVMNKMQSV
ncbi:MAG: HEAT repeat domain-containing protein [Syntrophorhabdaceae bacterium]|nr:HEAT repeat domain-containing protein [Syntrophorhabdaceae bacterium]